MDGLQTVEFFLPKQPDESAMCSPPPGLWAAVFQARQVLWRNCWSHEALMIHWTSFQPALLQPQQLQPPVIWKAICKAITAITSRSGTRREDET